MSEKKYETKVTSVSVFIVKNPTSKIFGKSKVVINDCLQLTGLKVISGSNGMFVSYPMDSSCKSEEYRDVFYPITSEFRLEIENAVLHEYKKQLALNAG